MPSIHPPGAGVAKDPEGQSRIRLQSNPNFDSTLHSLGLDKLCSVCYTQAVDGKREDLTTLLESERFTVTDSAAITGASRPALVGWLRRGLINTDHPLRLYRPMLTVADLVRIRATHVLTELGLRPEAAAAVANELCGGHIGGMLKLKGAFVMYRSKDGLLTYTACYPQSDHPGIPTCEACLIISPAAIAHEVITKALDYLAEQERRAQEDSE